MLHWASSDHVGAANAIKTGLERGNGGYWIHTSGTDILLGPSLLQGNKETAEIGEVKVYDDWDNIKEIITLPGKISICLAFPFNLQVAFKMHDRTALVTKSHSLSPTPQR